MYLYLSSQQYALFANVRLPSFTPLLGCKKNCCALGLPSPSVALILIPRAGVSIPTLQRRKLRLRKGV